MAPKVFDDDEDEISPQNEDFNTFEIDEAYGRRLEYNRKREDLQRLEELKKKGLVDEDDDDSEEESEPDEPVGDIKEFSKVFFGTLNKVKRKDPSIESKDVKFFESDETDEEEDEGDEKDEKDEKKKKKMYLKDVQAKQLLEEGPEFAEEDEEKIKTYVEQQEELKKSVLDAMGVEGGESEEDAEDFLKVTNKEDDLEEEEDEELVNTIDEYFGEEAEEEGSKFLRDYFVKQMWKEKDGKSKTAMIDESVLEEIDEDDDVLERDEKIEEEIQKLNRFRHEEDAGEVVMGQSRIVEGSVRKKDTSRKAQRKNKEERMKTAEIERQEELKRLKNVKKKEMKEKMKKVLSIAGFKEGEECPLDAKDLDDEFDPEEYDKMMKAAFDDKYYGEEDLELNSDEDDDEEQKPDFDKEDELLGLPKDWDVIKGQDGFVSAREKALKLNENVEEDEETEKEGKRKRKKKTSLVQRAKEALMEEYYKLDYEDTIGDLKTRFRYAKVQPNRYELDTEEILVLDDNELNQYVPLKKMAPYMEKDWEVNRHKVKEQKLKNKTLLEMMDGKKDDEKRSKKKRKKSEETKPVEKAEKEEKEGEEEEAAETSKLSRKAKRRRKLAEKKLPPNRMTAYGKV